MKILLRAPKPKLWGGISFSNQTCSCKVSNFETNYSNIVTNRALMDVYDENVPFQKYFLC